MKHEEITSAIIGSAIAIHRKFGPGLLESVYEALLAHELRKLGFTCECQKPIGLFHETLVIPDAFRADLVVNNKVLVELKSVEQVHPVHFKQGLTYMRLASIEVGLLINFSSVILKNGIHRLVCDQYAPLKL